MSTRLLRQALRRDLAVIAELWVEAFATDPFLRWIEPDDGRWPSFGAAWMTFVADLVFERGHTYVGEPADIAIAWVPPDIALVGADDIARGRAIIAGHAGDERAEDAIGTIVRARGHALVEPHWTLQYVGVRPGRQGAGLGAAAVAPILAACDADGLPCGLVSTNPRNLTFYERLGFTVDAEVRTAEGAAVMRPMHRPPGPPA